MRIRTVGTRLGMAGLVSMIVTIGGVATGAALARGTITISGPYAGRFSVSRCLTGSDISPFETVSVAAPPYLTNTTGGADLSLDIGYLKFGSARFPTSRFEVAILEDTTEVKYAPYVWRTSKLNARHGSQFGSGSVSVSGSGSGSVNATIEAVPASIGGLNLAKGSIHVVGSWTGCVKPG
jgi:hypothetical protein